MQEDSLPCELPGKPRESGSRKYKGHADSINMTQQLERVTIFNQLFDCCIELDEIKSGKTVANEDLGNKIKQLVTKLACPESADAWITWLELSSDARLLAECRKYILLYSYSPLAQEWSKKLKNKD